MFSFFDRKEVDEMSKKKSLFRFDSVDAALTRVQLVVIGIGLVVLGLVLPAIGAFSRPFPV